MDSVEILIPDKEGNHLVVVLAFYDKYDKTVTFRIPAEFEDVEIADISIEKLDSTAPLSICSFYSMCAWLQEQFFQYPNAIFTFICSTDPLSSRHSHIEPEKVRWNIFEVLYSRYRTILEAKGIKSKDLVVGPEGYQTYAKVFYREKHAPIIHLVISHLESKYTL